MSAPATPSRTRLYWSVTRAVFWRHMHIVFHKPALFVPALVFPLFFYMAFAGGLSGVSDAPGFDYYDYNAFQFTFVLLQSAAFGGIFIGFSIGADFDPGSRAGCSSPRGTAPRCSPASAWRRWSAR